MREATLMNKNKPVMKCIIDGTTIIKINEVIDKDMLPIVLIDNISEQKATEWLRGRIIPDKRDGLKEARNYFQKFECYKNMFSLSDQYWFTYKRTEKWENMNFFTNDYSEDIGKIFFAPWEVKKIVENPDLTTNGVLRKRWTRKNGKNYLIKAGSRRAGQDPISEVLASMVLEQIHIIPFVRYDMVIDGINICCICENFIDENTEYVPAGHIYEREPRKDNESVTEHMVRMAESYGIEGAAEFIEKMVVADHFICNSDRNLGNFGFIRSAETGKIEGFAPIFDCGSAFFDLKSSKSSFNEAEEKAIEKYMPELTKCKLDKKALFNLIDAYPKISEIEARDIKGKINKVFDEIKAAEKSSIEKLKEDDLLFK